MRFQEIPFLFQMNNGWIISKQDGLLPQDQAEKFSIFFTLLALSPLAVTLILTANYIIIDKNI